MGIDRKAREGISGAKKRLTKELVLVALNLDKKK